MAHANCERNQMEIALYMIVAVLLAALWVIARAVLPDKMSKYDAYVLMAFNWVEKSVDDDYGSSTEDPAYEKMIHKVDLFCKRFPELVSKFEGEMATKELMNYAMNLASILAQGDK